MSFLAASDTIEARKTSKTAESEQQMSKNETYTLHILRVGDHFEVTIAELPGISAQGATFDDALLNGQIAISAAKIAALKATKKPRTRRHQVA